MTFLLGAKKVFWLCGFCAMVLLIGGCRGGVGAQVKVTQTPFVQTDRCGGQFVAHDLPHVTAEAVERIGFFISNGSGLAVNDLDNDGDLDFVLGNIFGPIHIFWNQGEMTFEPEVLFEGSVRAVTAVDVDGDNWLDLVFSNRNGNIDYWRNVGEGQFEQTRLDNVRGYAYAIDWGDLDEDGDLDLVTASYDASMRKIYRVGFEESNLPGVYTHINRNGTFDSRKLSQNAQALALQLIDLDENGRLDIHVGNDFDVRDFIWLNSDDGWQPVEPFDTTTMSTMSFDRGDIQNDGSTELFAADMHPYSDDPEIMAQWQPIMDMMHFDLSTNDPQQMENVLQTNIGAASGNNISLQSNVSATGWSWSAKFGDLDQDGFLDLYVVNGMQALDNFSHLPNDELIEENQALQNQGNGTFALTNAWSLNSKRGGRSMSLADFDGDGDLDVLINNLGSPSQLFENQLCEGTAVQVKLHAPNSPNTQAIGAKLFLETAIGTLSRDVRVTSGYLSGDPVQVHFGLPEDTAVSNLRIVWPDGATSEIKKIDLGGLLVIERRN